MSTPRYAHRAPRRGFPLGRVLAVVGVLAVVCFFAAIGIALFYQPTPPPTPNLRATPPQLPASAPLRVVIPAIAADSTLIPTGVNQADHTMATPPLSEPQQASWYTGARTPGQVGPAVLLGHVNGSGRPGIFARLHELHPGDEVDVARADGTTAVFLVNQVRQYPKSDFPVHPVFDPTPDAQLRLITCGGSLDRRAHNYQDNVIAFATLVSVHRS